MTRKFRPGDRVFHPALGLCGTIIQINAHPPDWRKRVVWCADRGGVFYEHCMEYLEFDKPTPTQPSPEEIADIVIENRRLRDRVDELLRANNDLVEQRRTLARKYELIHPRREVDISLKVNFDFAAFEDLLKHLRGRDHRYFHLGAEADA